MMLGRKVLIFIAAISCIESHAARTIDYYLWPATNFKAQLGDYAACEILLEKGHFPTESESLRLSKAKQLGQELLSASLKIGFSGNLLPKPLKQELERLSGELKEAQSRFGYDYLDNLGMIGLKEDVNSVLVYDGYIPKRDELETLAGHLREQVKDSTARTDQLSRAQIHWDISILQQLTALYNFASPQSLVPMEECDQIIRAFFPDDY